MPGRVSTAVDVNLAFDTDRALEKARSILRASDAGGVSRDRVAIKIAATRGGTRGAPARASIAT